MSENEINTFYREISGYGYLDVKTAVNVFLEVGLNGYALAEEVLRFSEETGTELQNIDVCYIAFDYILQQARNKIDEVLNYDFINDYEGIGTVIHTYGKYGYFIRFQRRSKARATKQYKPSNRRTENPIKRR